MIIILIKIVGEMGWLELMMIVVVIMDNMKGYLAGMRSADNALTMS